MYIPEITYFADVYGDSNTQVSDHMQQVAEDTFKKDEIFRPMFMFFDSNKNKTATLTLRDVKSKADKNIAFVEACMLFPVLSSEYAYFIIDDFVSTKNEVKPEDDPDKREALIVISLIPNGAKALVSPYSRDKDDHFLHWDTPDTANYEPQEIEETLLSIIAHYISKDIQFSTHNEFFDTLRQRGHELIIEETFKPLVEYPI